MPDFTIQPNQHPNGDYPILANGAYHLPFWTGKRSFSAKWDAKEITPAGKLVFSSDGDYGKRPLVIDITAGERTLPRLNALLRNVKVEVTGLPDGGGLILYCE